MFAVPTFLLQLLRSVSPSGSEMAAERVIFDPDAPVTEDPAVNVGKPFRRGESSKGLFTALAKFNRPPVVVVFAFASLSVS